MNHQNQTYTNPITRIHNIYPSLSTTQKSIADLVLEQEENVCFMRLEDISKLIGVTNVTVIRFAKKLGYDSFGAFKRDLQNYVQTSIVPKRIIKSEIKDLRDTSADDIIHNAIQNEFHLMHATYDNISPETLYETAMLIKNARKVYIVGTGLNEPITEILLVRLKFLSIDAEIISGDNLTLLPHYLINISKEDVFVIFSFPNYKEFAIKMAKCAHEIGCHTVCITDRPTAPTSYYAEKLILCQTSSLVYYNSMTTPTSLVTLLSSILAVYIEKDQKTQERIDYISSFFQ